MILIKGFTISHFKGFDIEFGIDTVVVAVLGYEKLGVCRERDVGAVVVEGTRGAMRDSEIRIFFYRNLLLPLPDEGGVYLSLILQGEAVPETLRGFTPVGVLFWRCEIVPNKFKGSHFFKISFNLLPSLHHTM